MLDALVRFSTNVFKSIDIFLFFYDGNFIHNLAHVLIVCF